MWVGGGITVDVAGPQFSFLFFGPFLVGDVNGSCEFQSMIYKYKVCREILYTVWGLASST